MEKKVMVFPPTERRQAIEFNRTDSVTRWLHYQEFEVDHQLIHSEPDEWGFEASLELTRMQLTGRRGSASEATFDITQPLLPDEKDARGRHNEKGN
jgi:hypothetical protein